MCLIKSCAAVRKQNSEACYSICLRASSVMTNIKRRSSIKENGFPLLINEDSNKSTLIQKDKNKCSFDIAKRKLK